MFDLTRFMTLKNIENWISILRKHDPNLPVLFVGTKIDLIDLIAVDDDHALSFLEKFNMFDFIKISSKTGENFDKTFELIIRKLMNI